MDGFNFYLHFGFDHILDMDAQDHIAFLVALCAIYRLSQWRTILILVTAFTIGHSITLALSALDILTFKKEWIELLIPVTILITALYNIFKTPALDKASIKGSYWLALIFGCIHGMGFSNTLKSMLMPGEEGQFIQQLLAFNLGVELGQLIIVFIILVLSYIALNFFRIRQKDWTIFVSGAAFGVAILLLFAQL